MTRKTTGYGRWRGALVLLLLLACLPQVARAQSDGYASFEDGNRLFRDNLYWAALLRYRQAAEAGLDTPLLHFNTGAAHYKAQQHIRAREAFLRAAESADMRVIAHYNLGLNAWAAGNDEEAADWFRRARDQQGNEKIRDYAIVALARLQAEQRAEDPVVEFREKRREADKPIANFEIRARVGAGSDDNIFRAPSQPYVDFADPDQPVVTPEVYSATYVPFDFRAKYKINSLKWENFFGGYRVAGRLYDGELENNADEYRHELRFGSEFDRREDGRRNRVYSAFTIAQNDEQYVDPDTGNPRVSNGQEITDRMNYVRYGPQLKTVQAFGDLSFALRLKGELWDYEDTEVVPEYDHEYFLFGGNVQYKFAPSTLLRLTVEKSSRRYSSRPSFDLDGNQLVTNPALRYDYLEYGLLARQRITDDVWFGFSYELMEREDRFVGYNDYTRYSYGFEFHWSPGRRFDLEMEASYRDYDYPNAFAFHEPVAGPKTLETLDAEIVGTWRISRHFRLVAEFDYRETASTDTRIEYDRTRYSLSVVWEM